MATLLTNQVYLDGTASIEGNRVTHDEYRARAMTIAHMYAQTMARHAATIMVAGWIRTGGTPTDTIDIVAVPFETADLTGTTMRLALGFVNMSKMAFPQTYYGSFNRSVRQERVRTGFFQDGFKVFVWLSKSYRYGFDAVSRTGPETFASWLLNQAVARGKKSRLSIHDNALWKEIVTPEGVSQGKKPVAAMAEEDVFRLAGVGYVPPADRYAPVETFTRMNTVATPDVYSGTMLDREQGRDYGRVK